MQSYHNPSNFSSEHSRGNFSAYYKFSFFLPSSFYIIMFPSPFRRVFGGKQCRLANPILYAPRFFQNAQTWSNRVITRCCIINTTAYRKEKICATPTAASARFWTYTDRKKEVLKNFPSFSIYTEAVGSRENGPSESIIAFVGLRLREIGSGMLFSRRGVRQIRARFIGFFL